MNNVEVLKKSELDALEVVVSRMPILDTLNNFSSGTVEGALNELAKGVKKLADEYK